MHMIHQNNHNNNCKQVTNQTLSPTKLLYKGKKENILFKRILFLGAFRQQLNGAMVLRMQHTLSVEKAKNQGKEQRSIKHCWSIGLRLAQTAGV